MFKSLFLVLLAALLAGCGLPGARPGLVVDEHLLTAPPDLSTDQLVFHLAEGDQATVLARTRPYKDFLGQALAYNRRALEPFGYQLKVHQLSENGYTHEVVDIYHAGQLVVGHVDFMGPVSLNASQTDFIGLGNTSGDAFVLTAGKFEMRPWPPGREPYTYVGDRLLSVELTGVSHQLSHVQVYLDDTSAFESDFNNVSTYGAFDGPWAYDGHWALILLDANMDGQQGPEAYDRLILDGQDVNASKGYEQAFEFSVLDGRPFYFYQKNGKIGISFNGQESPRDYDEIPHYQCCTPALLNPGKSMNMVWFFARRGSSWYYVEAYVPLQP